MRAFLLVVAMSTAVLAGCAEAPESETAPITTADIEAGSAAPLPEWTVGMFWEFQHSFRGEPGDVATYVVTETSGDAYVLDVNNKQTAEYDARYDISFVGDIRKSDLAGSQNGQAIAMFEWPLSHDKEWTTNWDGDALDMFSTNMGPMQFHVMGHRQSDGQMMVEYHYNALKSWFEYIVFYNGTSGEEEFRMDLNNHGADFAGQVYRYAFGDVRGFAATAADGAGIQDVTFDAQWNELHATYDVMCNGDTSGQNAIGLNPPEKRDENPGPMLPFVNEPEHGFLWDCSEGAEGHDVEVMPNNGGDWELGLLAGGPNSMVHVLIEERALTTITL